MRTCIAIVLSVVATVSSGASGELSADPYAKPLLQWIAATPIDFSADSKMFLRDYEADQKYLIDVRDFKSRPWFKPLVIAYWVGAAVKSYQDDDGVRLKSYLGREPTVHASFQTLEGSRAIFVPRSHPVILFPLGNDRHVDRLLTIHVAGGGGAVSYAMTLGPPRHLRR